MLFTWLQGVNWYLMAVAASLFIPIAVMLHPYLARAAIEVTFNAFNQYAGLGVGQHLGYPSTRRVSFLEGLQHRPEIPGRKGARVVSFAGIALPA
jgi:hypothetical protein